MGTCLQRGILVYNQVIFVQHSTHKLDGVWPLDGFHVIYCQQTATECPEKTSVQITCVSVMMTGSDLEAMFSAIWTDV